MRDFVFGEYISASRKKLGITQEQLAQKLGVSNKAVSKWESGASKPSIERLKGLAKIFKVSMEEILSKHAQKTRQISKIVVTGGPCAGKTTAMIWIQRHFEKLGYAVLFVPECATELILGGIASWTLESNFDFEVAILKMQQAKEKLFDECAKKIYGKDKVLIVCDRGFLDCKVYMEEYEFEEALSMIGLEENVARDSYDAVFHLVSVAKDAPQFYTYETNKARFETIEEAIENDNKTLNAWTGHPHLRILDNSTDFEGKMKRLLKEISAKLGEPEPYEIERKFLVSMPNIEKLEKECTCKKVEIIQTYLQSTEDEVRVRQRGLNGGYTYTKTIKKKIEGMRRVEYEERISQQEYLGLLMEADTTKKQIKKTRYCFVYNNQYFELDIYPFWRDQAILEIELNDEKQEVDFPNFIEILKEVTNDENYNNCTLATI